MPEVKASGLTFRLPTKKEWKYACRAGSTGDCCKLADGTEITKSTLDEVAWYDGNSDRRTHPVGQKKPNAFGLYDMHGNVWEWCEDRADFDDCVFQGGSWARNSRACTADSWYIRDPDNRYTDLGFRLAASQDSQSNSQSGMTLQVGADTAAVEAVAKARAELDAERIVAEAESLIAKAKAMAAAEAIVERSGDEKASVGCQSNTTLCVGTLAGSMVMIPGQGYAICKYEVTQAIWEEVMGANPSRFKGPNLPVEEVSWNDCQEFIKKLNALPEVQGAGFTYRLPTEKEWEYACRAGSTGDYCKLADGTEITESTLGEVAWYSSNSGSKRHPVGQKKPNAFGLYDMHGNVWEWCEDFYRAGDSYRVDRGGSWCNASSRCAAGYRDNYYPDYRNYCLGFRLAASQDVNR